MAASSTEREDEGLETEALRQTAAPVHELPDSPGQEGEVDKPAPGVALCLSGGGYRAMLFHLGALWRLNELGWLPKLERISSVSGGSIMAGILACHWDKLSFGGSGVAPEFHGEIASRVHGFAHKTIDLASIALGIVLPGSIGNRLAGAYRKHLFGDMTLQALPARPRFVFNAASLQSGALVRFSAPYVWDYRIGAIDRPELELAVAVAASSSFPPFLSPVTPKFDPAMFRPGSGTDLEEEDYRRKLVLTDGGVYDNLGLETAWKRYETILISDGGGRLGPQARPARLWPLQLYRVLGVIDNQVRSLRKRQAIDSYKAKLRSGTYWGIRSEIADYRLPDALPCPPEKTRHLAAVKTRLKDTDDATQQGLVNWGYGVCDAAMRRHVIVGAQPPSGFPYPGAGLG